MDDLVNVGYDARAMRAAAFTGLVYAISSLGFPPLGVMVLAGVVWYAL